MGPCGSLCLSADPESEASPGGPAPAVGLRVYSDAEADVVSAEASTAICVQRFDDSRNSAIHTTYRISLRSSSLREPRYPLLRVVSVKARGRACKHSILVKCVMAWVKMAGRAGRPPRGGAATGTYRLFGFAGCGLIGFNDPSAGSPTETLLRLLLPLNGRVQRNSRSGEQGTCSELQS